MSGKRGLSLVLNGEPFEPTDSSGAPRMDVWFGRVKLSGNRKQTRDAVVGFGRATGLSRYPSDAPQR